MASPILFIALASQPISAKEDGRKEAPVACPIDVQMRVASPNTLSRFESLSECGAQFVAMPAGAATQPIPDGTAVVRIIGVEDRASRGKKVSKARAPKVMLVRSAFDREIRTVAASYKIDPLFLHALVDAESGYRPTARSRVGALGLMQIMPATGAGLGVKTTALLNPSTNLDAGARHLKQLQKRYGQNFDLILSAYNAGAGAVQRYGNKIPPYAETQAYVVKVMNRYGALRSSLTAVAAGAGR
jgi:soluble lytic murein transglycosylase-like protein